MCHRSGAGISAGVTWNNTSSTTVPAVELDLGQTGNEGALWTFKYCTGGDEPDPGPIAPITCKRQIDVCRGQFGDALVPIHNRSNAQGAFTDAVQTALWTAGPDTRVGSTFDIEVNVTRSFGYTTANLWGTVDHFSGRRCRLQSYNCDCVSQTTAIPLTGRQLHFPASIALDHMCRQ